MGLIADGYDHLQARNFSAFRSIRYSLGSHLAMRQSLLFDESWYFEAEGKHSDIIARLMFCRGTRLFWELKSYADGFVSPRKIVGTDHPDYPGLYSKAEDGGFDPGEGFPGKRGDPGEGWKSGWDKPRSSSDKISLMKHPVSDRYIVGAGNHRVMKSKMMDGPDVFATVSQWEWNPLIKRLLRHLPQNALYIRILIPDGTRAYVKIRESRGCRSFQHLFRAEGHDYDSTLFYLRAALARIPRFRPQLLVLWFLAYRLEKWAAPYGHGIFDKAPAWARRFLDRYGR